MTKSEVARKYSITTTHFKYWMRKFGFLPQLNGKHTIPKPNQLSTNTKESDLVAYRGEIYALKCKIKNLNKALQHEKMRAEGYKIIIDITKKRNIPC